MLSRRGFLGVAGVLGVSLLGQPLWAAPASVSATPGAGASAPPVLVVVLLRGAADGLSISVPHGEAEYYRLRKQIAIAQPGAGKAEARAIDLDGRFGLHPALAPLLPAWRAKELSLIPAFGSPDPTRSHFEAQDRLELGVAKTPGAAATKQTQGLLSRMAGSLKLSDPLGAVALASTTPVALRGSSPGLSLGGVDDFGLDAPPSASARLEQGFNRLYARASGQGGLGASLGEAGTRGLRALGALRGLPRSSAPRGYPPGKLGAALHDMARLIHAPVGLRLGFLDVGGWDTHTAQGAGGGGRLARSLTELGRGLAAFREELGEHQARVVTLVMTEFGRTAAQNGSGGTDHGHGSTALLLGGPVAGGRLLGRWPGLAPEQLYHGRDVAVTTDFRDVIAELGRAHLGIDGLFPGHSPGGALGLLR